MKEVDKLREEIVCKTIGYMNSDNTIILDNVVNGTYTLKLEDWAGELTDYESFGLTVTDTEKEYLHFIMENRIPAEAKRIGVYDSTGAKVGNIRITNRLNSDDLGNKLYRFFECADVHITGAEEDDGTTDFNNAMDFVEAMEAEFVVVDGDFANGGTAYELEKIKALIEARSLTVHATSGNHEAVSSGVVSSSDLETYYGNPLYYSFERGNDVFIMVGEYGWTDNLPFADGELQWLYETLETYRNKRCFVHFHPMSFDDGDSGNPNGFYADNMWNMTNNAEVRAKQKQCFLDLLKHYKNTIWFHGHSHAMLQLQELDSRCNYTDKMGYKSVHVPSLAKPKNIVDGEVVTVEAGSQGYMVDVYKDCIVLRGRDFALGKYLPIGIFKIDTPLVEVTENTFTDNSGLIEVVESCSVTNNLTNTSNSNTSNRVVKGASYTATITPDRETVQITSVTVTMGGVDVTADVYSDGVITIPSVTGDVVITVVGEVQSIDVPLTWQIGTKIDKNAGTDSTSSTYSATDYVDYSESLIMYIDSAFTSNSGTGINICCYDASKAYLGYVEIFDNAEANAIAGQSYALTGMKDNTAYIRLRYYNGQSTHHETQTALITMKKE